MRGFLRRKRDLYLFRQAYILKVFSITKILGLDFKPQKSIRFSDKSYIINIIKLFN